MLCFSLLLWQIAIFGHVVVTGNNNLITSRNLDVCTTPGCVKAASNLIEAIDTSKDPCNDFFEYACGRWKEQHSIPDDMPTYSTFSLVRERVTKQIRSLLEQNSTCSSKAVSMVRKLYSTCVDTETLNKIKSQSLIDAIRKLGGWPLLDGTWTQDKFDVTDFLARLRRDYGVEVFINLIVSSDSKNASNTMLSLDQGRLGLGSGTRNYYLNDTLYGKQFEAYKKLMIDMVGLLTTDLQIPMTQNMIVDLNEIMAFERQLANITVPQENRRNASLLYNKWTIAILTNITPFIDWNRFFKIIMPEEVFTMANSPNFYLNVMEPGYMSRLESLFKETDKRVLINYVVWRFVKSWSSVLDVRFDDISQTFSKAMYGREEKPVKWKRCVPATTGLMDMAAGSLYVKEHFKKEDKVEALAMIKNIQQAFKDIVLNLDWMDSQTKRLAAEKADAMLDHIGYPDFILSDPLIDEYYSKLDISDNDNYFDAVRKVTVWHQYNDMIDLLKPFDRQKFVAGPSDVNAYYDPDRNAIFFPSGILQPPFFRGDFPKAVNYGAIGAVIGHEITHGFDDQGSQYDKVGNVHDWWSSSASEKFREKTKCFIDQYGNYTVPGINTKVNGKLTQGENIADNGGVKQAFKAYKKYLRDIGREESRLPGLQSMTNEQIFFLSFANFWCGHVKPAYAVAQLLTDPHSPYIFRIVGSLSNFEEFSNAFKCPKGSAMNLDSVKSPRCSIW